MDLAVADEAERHAAGKIQEPHADPPAFVMAFGCDTTAQLAKEVLT